MNLLEILRKVQLKLGRQFDIVGNESIIQDILDGYRDICIKNNWSFFLKEGKIHTYPYVKHQVTDVHYATKTYVVEDAIPATDATLYSSQRAYIPSVNSTINLGTVTAAAKGSATVALQDEPIHASGNVTRVIGTSGVSILNDTLYWPDHGFSDDDPLYYSNAGGASIGGLTDGLVYYCIVVDSEYFQLADTPGATAKNLTGTGNDTQFFRRTGLGVDDYLYLYIPDYPMPSDCAFNKEISILDTALNRRLAKVVEPTLTKATKWDWFTFDTPRVYMAKSRDYRASTDNSNYIMFWPFLNPTEKNLSIWYYRKPFGNFDTFTYTGGTTAAHLLPEIPEEFAHLLEWMALEQAYLKLGDSRLGYAIQKKYDIFKELLDANNGDIAMEHILKESPPLGYEGIPDFNTINVRVV